MSDPVQISIRPARIEDSELILHFIQELAAYEKLAHEAIGTREDLEQHLFGERPAAEVLIAEADGEPAGFALFFTNFSTFLARPGIYLEDLFVPETHRGLGVGKRLLAALAALVVERDYGRLDWSVLDWNRPAIDFYESIGAFGLDDWTQYRLTGEPLERLAATVVQPSP